MGIATTLFLQSLICIRWHPKNSLSKLIALYRNYIWGPFPVKTGSNPKIDPMKKPTKTKLRIIQHTLKPDMTQAFAVLMYSSLSSYFKKHIINSSYIQLSVIHQ